MTEKGMSFSFRYTTQEKPYNALQNLDKKGQENELCENNKMWHHHVFSYFIHHNLNTSLSSELKKAYTRS